jgi:hypothetical protein
MQAGQDQSFRGEGPVREGNTYERHKLFVYLFFGSITLFAQGDRGTITGTVSDPAGAVIANASIDVKNSETGIVYQTTTTATGNYTLAQVPVGKYELTATAPGFKKYVRPNIAVEVARLASLVFPTPAGGSLSSPDYARPAPRRIAWVPVVWRAWARADTARLARSRSPNK